jgi:hypothetical protein
MSVGPNVPPGSAQNAPAQSAFDERVKKSFDFLQDATKQLITLATVILTFTITFLKDVAKTAGEGPRFWITLCWISLVVSCGFGLLVLLNMTGVLGKPSETPDIYRPSIRLFSGLQLLGFGLALVFALAFATTWS